MKPEPEWLLPEVVVAVHRALIAEHGGADGIRDRDLLESTLARPRNLFVYAEEEVSLFDLAASYAYEFARNHCFVDGNKRVAFTAALTFLDLHGFRLEAPREERVLTFLRLAAGEVSERDLSFWLRSNSRAIR